MQWFGLDVYSTNPGGPDTGELTFAPGDTRGYGGNLTIHIFPRGHNAQELRWALETRPASASAYFCIKY
jgi:hypothetical protein